MTPVETYPALLLLRAHLEGRLRQGETRLWLQPDAAEALREIVRMKPSPAPPRTALAPTMPEFSVPTPCAAEAPVLNHGNLIVPKPLLSSKLERLGSPILQETDAFGKDESALPGLAPGQDVQDPQRLMLPPRENVTLSLAEREARLSAVRARALEGQEAKALGTLRETMVFAAGSPMAGIVLVGEAPGAEEERQGEPFVGPAGQLLTKVLKVMGLERDQVYITNICKYRPAMENQGSGNRQPSPLEMASCLEFVREEIDIIRPRVIVALGGTAITGLLGIKTGVMNARGRFYEFEGIPVMATLHPSYLLRKEQEGPETANAEKRKLWEDMLMVMERAGMAVTTKQRAFFLPR